MTPRLRKAFLENPEYILALMFSAPDDKSSQHQSLTIDFLDNEVRATVPLREAPTLRLLASKETIYAAIAIYEVLMGRAGYEDTLFEEAISFGRSAALQHPQFTQYEGEADEVAEVPDTSSFFRQIDVGPRNTEVALRKTDSALTFLEDEGLAIDPAFAPGLMVLTGLIPVHFSIRTPKGQRIYKEICINAPYWSLKVARGRNNDGHFNDVDFRFRGIEIVKKAITAMATQYLESEEDRRRRSGKAVIRRPHGPQLDED